jgi:hypothetical protein
MSKLGWIIVSLLLAILGMLVYIGIIKPHQEKQREFESLRRVLYVEESRILWSNALVRGYELNLPRPQMEKLELNHRAAERGFRDEEDRHQSRYPNPHSIRELGKLDKYMQFQQQIREWGDSRISKMAVRDFDLWIQAVERELPEKKTAAFESLR